MKRTIVVDDNPLVRESICRTIRWTELGCALVGEFSNGAEGLEYALQFYPDIIITDIKMPVLGGLDMIKALKEKYTGFCSIIITGFNEFQYAQEALRLGAADIILKPIDNRELEKIILHAIGNIDSTVAPQSLGLSEQATATEKLARYSGEPIRQKHCSILVRRALDYIKSNLDHKISLGELADYVGLSPAHLSRLFKKDQGMSFVDVVNQMRVQVAISLLREGRYKVYEVSNMIGIDNYAYFYQLFKKLTGKTPKEYLSE